MADDALWSIGFFGPGDSTEANVRENLDRWVPDDLGKILVPAAVSRRAKGLKFAVTWLEEELGEKGVTRAETVGDILSELRTQRDKGDDVYLVYLPSDEVSDDDRTWLEKAIGDSIPILNLAEGLLEYELPDAAEKLADPPKEPTQTRTRGRARASATTPPAPEANASDDPPWDTSDEKGAEVVGITVGLLSHQTIQHLAQFATSFLEDIRLAAAPPGVAPGAEKLPFWLSADGRYRRRGKGRKRNGEEPVELANSEIEAITAKGLIDNA